MAGSAVAVKFESWCAHVCACVSERVVCVSVQNGLPDLPWLP